MIKTRRPHTNSCCYTRFGQYCIHLFHNNNLKMFKRFSHMLSVYYDCVVVAFRKMSVVTRHCVSCDIFGASKQMPTSVHPTYTDVIKFYNLTKSEMKREMSQKDLGLSQ